MIYPTPPSTLPRESVEEAALFQCRREVAEGRAGPALQLSLAQLMGSPRKVVRRHALSLWERARALPVVAFDGVA